MQNKTNFADWFIKMTNDAVTEKGAHGYATTKNSLVDINFQVSTLRSEAPYTLGKMMESVLNEYKILPLIWLFYLRDCRGGLGERKATKHMLNVYLQKYGDKEITKDILRLVPYYGRWDDIIDFAVGDFLLSGDTYGIQKVALEILGEQLVKDFHRANDDESISLLAKWMPSANAGKKSREKALRLIKMIKAPSGALLFGTEREYRKLLSFLRVHCGTIVEHNLCDKSYDTLDYTDVTAGAHLKYRKAFVRNDLEHYKSYLTDVAIGKSTMHNNGVTPYQLCYNYDCDKYNDLYREIPEQLSLIYDTAWDNLLNAKKDFFDGLDLSDTIVVCDGSGSMTRRIGNTNVEAIHVSRSLAMFCAAQLKGSLHDKVIEFSAEPRFIDLSDKEGFVEKYEWMKRFSAISTTTIHGVFYLLLDAVVTGQINREDMPKQILIISDMQFDNIMNASLFYTFSAEYISKEKLFDYIEKEWNDAGLQMPKLIFWNVSSSGDFKVIPKIENAAGLSLISGFGVEALKGTTKKDPAESLLSVLLSARYEPVHEIIEKHDLTKELQAEILRFV